MASISSSLASGRLRRKRCRICASANSNSANVVRKRSAGDPCSAATIVFYRQVPGTAGQGGGVRRSQHPFRPRATGLALLLLAALGAAGCRPAATRDPLAADVARWSELLHRHGGAGADWAGVRQAGEAGLASTREALRGERRLLALQRLAEVRVELAAAAYVRERSPVQRQDAAAFGAEWARMGNALRGDLGPPSPGALAGVRPAAARAIGEAALPQVRAYYQASLDYGRNTLPQYGLSYLGTAEALRQLVAFCRTLGDAFPNRRQPRLRPLDVELDALEGEVLAAYRPPASIARHGDFIGASSLLKEARELNAAGLRYGALLRYLQAALAARPLRSAPPDSRPAALARQLRETEARLDADDLDHSIGRLFLEIAQAHLPAPAAPRGGDATAAAILDDVLPRYFAALGPAPRQPPRQPPSVTVTLVRWPYT
jgi:hypothetical protein